MPQYLNGRILSDLADEISEMVKKNHYALTPAEVHVARKPRIFNRRSLDERLIIAAKLNKRVCIVVIDQKSEISNKDFSRMFRQTYLTPEKNNKAAELFMENGISIIASDTIARYMQRAELFLNSDFMAATKAMKKIRQKKGFSNQIFSDAEVSLKDIFMHTVLRMYFAMKPMTSYLEVMSLNIKEFTILAILWMDARALSNDAICSRYERLAGEPAPNRGYGLSTSFKYLGTKGYIEKEFKESTHIKEKKGLFMLTQKGHDVIFNFVKKVADETMSNVYE